MGMDPGFHRGDDNPGIPVCAGMTDGRTTPLGGFPQPRRHIRVKLEIS
jgi:hypothetical protein